MKKDTVNRLFQLFIEELEQRKFNKLPVELYNPINYIMDLGGKRLRPILLLMGYELFKKDSEKALAAAYAVELFHNFSLVHDDIMDAADLRRGRPSVHAKYNTNTAILSGDVMLIYVYQCLMELEQHPNLHTILHIFNRLAIGVCEGQQMDMNFEQQDNVTLTAYLKMIELKTGVLIAGALQIGALIAHANLKDAQHLYEFGKNIGIAFQLQDDLLDSFGDPAKFGKKVGGDIIQNKKTYLVLKAYELADKSLKTKLQNLLSNTFMPNQEKIEAVKMVFTQLDIPKYAAAMQKHYQELAMQYLEQIKIEKSKKMPLINLANELLRRDL